MTKIAVNNNTVSVGVFTPIPILTNTRFVKINGQGVVLVGDGVATHTDFTPNPDIIHPGPVEGEEGGTTMTSTQSYVKVNGIPIVVNGSSASCNISHTVVGTGFVDIN